METSVAVVCCLFQKKNRKENNNKTKNRRKTTTTNASWAYKLKLCMDLDVHAGPCQWIRNHGLGRRTDIETEFESHFWTWSHMLDHWPYEIIATGRTWTVKTLSTQNSSIYLCVQMPRPESKISSLFPWTVYNKKEKEKNGQNHRNYFLSVSFFFSLNKN